MSRKASGTEKEKLGKAKGQMKKGEYAPAELTTTWDRFPGIADDLPTLAAEYILKNQEIAAAEKRKSELKNEIETIQAECREKVLAGDFFVVERVTAHSPRKLSETKLLENGVNLDTINKSYEGGVKYEYTQVRSRD